MAHGAAVGGGGLGEPRHGRHGAVRGRRRRRGPGRPRGGVPPGAARAALRDPGRRRAHRQLLAQAVGTRSACSPRPASMGCRACRSPRRPRRSPRRTRWPTTWRPTRRASPCRCARASRWTGSPGSATGSSRRPAAAGSRPTTWCWPWARTSAPGSRPSPPRSIRRSCSCTPASTGDLPSCGRAAPSSWAPATRGPRSPWRRPAGTGPGCRGGTRGTSRSAPGAGPSGWSFP